MKGAIRFLVIICIVCAFLYIGWKRWLVTTPRPLPQKSTTAAATSNPLIQGAYYEVSIPPTKSDWYSSATYRLWIPDQRRAFRGLMVMQHGCGDGAEASGLDHANDLQWQALASKHKFAILGSKLSSDGRPCEFWAFPSGGSDIAFLKALHVLGQNSGHLEIETVPWVLRGHSGGAEWVVYMLQKYPDRTIAAVAMRGGGYLLIGGDASTLNVPVLFAAGEDDPYDYDSIEVPKQVFLRQRKEGALWAFVLTPNTAHETGNTRSFAIPYLDAVIAKRLDPKSGRLIPIEAAEGWLGDIVTHTIVPVKDYTGNSSEASVWLPSEEVARKWKQYVSKGEIPLTRKPAAPTGVRALKNTDTEAIITWNFTPDLENGLPSFRIYRGRSLVATLQGQEHNFGDAPEPSSVVLEFVDKDAQFDSTYTVAAFNTFGESASESTPLQENR